MNELMKWASSQEQFQPFSRKNLTRVPGLNEAIIPDFLKSPSVNKLLVSELPKDLNINSSLNPSHSIILGGMCLVNTVEMKSMAHGEIKFSSINQFEEWYKSWYPRIDQIHDTVGIPPNICQKIIYVSEDSFFADRISSYTGLDRSDIQSILRKTHESQGHPTLEKYLKNQGYKGNIEVVYTSEINKELDSALRIWERILGINFRGADRNFAKVELMYTGFWLDILNIQSSAIIFEAANKMVLKGWLKIEDWFNTQRYGTGINRNLGIIGYLPFLTSEGDASEISYNNVPNYRNYKTYEIPKEELLWYITNILYPKKIVVENGPSSLSDVNATNMIRSDLQQYYE